MGLLAVHGPTPQVPLVKSTIPSGQPCPPWAPWHPLWGGEIHSRGGPWPPSGREINGYPFTTFTDFPDFLGIIPRVYVRILVRLHRFYRFLLVNIVDRFLPIACRRLQSSILLKIRPPEELLHQTCRTFRAESDSSALEVVWRLVSGSF